MIGGQKPVVTEGKAKRKRIAFIAHNQKKAQIVSFAMHNRKLIESLGLDLVTTGSTGDRLEESGFKIYKKYKSGHDGGDIDIASRVLDDKIICVFFFVDPLSAHPHDSDISSLIRTCNIKNVPLATNPRAAELLLKGLIEEQNEQ